ncbi:MAG: aldolase catalytic domain-containing protein [Flavobacteriaceae bacterium]|nr:aldolase catalytic domain-containing protein [Mangrovimonas sp.]MCB0425867.1 aldolase catalytic domain-containing protein [Mangrovimonas sp.]MCB0432055.1 aldolase catalytic domain-containing protein [Mangrovimonas sp.]MCB0434579.1 aldolase catalytic domain-containing protein [Mangrovimonas sp.]MCB0437203.1 aldolase catalytic domain-containing protein [Mangrovimonas sp.]
MINNTKILDCTLRDGGYYTNWDFDRELVAEYCKLMEELPVDYVEVGYRSIPLGGYLGEYFYCPEYVLKELKSLMPTKKLVIILNEKDIRVEHLDNLLTPCKPYIAMVRIAIDPKNFDRAIGLAKGIKAMGFEVGFNVMYMSNWRDDQAFLDLLEGMEDTIDYFYMVDSFGGVTLNDVKEITALVKTKTTVPLGFHGHNNLEMALINTLTAVEEGCQIVDGTITGMGRGAGNLRTELLLTYLDSINTNLNLNFTQLSNVVSSFEKLKSEYNWGTNLPYMFSGAHSLPQKQVMEWVGMNRFPISSILNALNNQKADIKDNVKLPVLEKGKGFKKAIILGGGKSAKKHVQAIKKLLETDGDTFLIHAGVRNVSDYIDINCIQYYTLVGFESEKLLSQIKTFSTQQQTCIFPPFPRKMGTIIPAEIQNLSKEIEAIDFTTLDTDSPLSLAIQAALDNGVETILFAGFDGYDTTIDQVQFVLAQENQKIFDDLSEVKELKALSITPTKYKNLNTTSIYSFLE